MNYEEKYWFLKHNFLSWTGTDGNYAQNLHITKIMFTIALILTILFVIIWWIFKRQIYAHWQKHKPSERVQGILIRTMGALLLIGMLLRSLNMGLHHYPRIWETIPLHFCRLIGVCFGIIFLLNKPRWMKYFATPAYIGAFIALIIPDLKIVYTPDQTFEVFGEHFTNGKDVVYYVAWNNVIFWEWLGLHMFMIISASVVSVLYPYKLTKKDVIQQCKIFMVFLLVTFTINTFTDGLAPLEWKSNYFYTGFDKYNGFSNLLGPLLHWPFSLFTMSVAIFAYAYLAAYIFDIQDRIHFNFKKGNIVSISKYSTKGFIESFKKHE